MKRWTTFLFLLSRHIDERRVQELGRIWREKLKLTGYNREECRYVVDANGPAVGSERRTRR
jgi:hypothetical protein